MLGISENAHVFLFCFVLFFIFSAMFGISKAKILTVSFQRLLGCYY